MEIEQFWYKNAVIYAVDVHRFKDANGDGHGDLAGLTQELDYIADLGVTCLWLLPFYPSPGRDNGYDVTNYYGIDPKVGTFDDFMTFLRKAGERSIRVILDMVVDHTSDEHPWFQAARHDRDARFRGYYTWADQPPPVPPGEGTIFPGEEDSVWTFDEVSRSYYFHRFYHFEPTLNVSNPDVVEEIRKVMDYWFSFGISGLRIDAASHLIEAHGLASTQPSDPHGLLRDLRDLAASRQENALLLGEADVAPENLAPFFGDGDELNMLFNFVLNNYFFLALARESAEPIIEGLNQVPEVPTPGQWANFLRNLDELDLERLSEADREEIYAQFAPEETMRIYGRGIRRRLAPMLKGDRRQMEMAWSLLFSLPGTPMFVYGDELGMGDDLSQKGRNAVRAPMQWADEQNAGFSSASSDALIQPVIEEGPFGYHEVNVADQQGDPDSFLNWMKALIQLRRACPELGYGTWRLYPEESEAVIAHRCAWQDGIVMAVHNLCGEEQQVTLDLRDQRGRDLVDLFGNGHHKPIREGAYEITLGPYGYKWFRIRGERAGA